MNPIIPEPTPTVEIPAAGNRCVDVLEDTLTGFAGIQSAEFDLTQGRLLLNYDPQVLSQEHALGLVRKAGEQAYGRVTQCAVMNEKACAACAAAMDNGLAASYRRLASSATADSAAPAVSYRAGLVEVRLPAPAGIAAAQAEAILAGAPAPARLPAIPRQALEIIFTAVTLLAGLAAWLGETSGLLPGLAVGGLYALAFLAGGYYGLLDALKTLRERRLDVNLLMILAALGAAVIGQPAEGAALLFLFSLSNTLQSYAMGRSRKAIEKLLDLRPKLATVRRGSRLVSLPVEKVVIGDTALVRPGERFPVDGQVLAGSSAADQATITGESMPVQKYPGDVIFAGTVNGNGALEVRVSRLAQDSTLARLVHMVEEAQGSKARTQRALDNFEQFYALIVLGAAGVLMAAPPLLFGEAFSTAFYRAMTWLVVASPCALVISTPASFLSAIANGARRGILFKGGVHLEQTAAIQVIAFDKTGTLTTGSPKLTSLVPLNGLSEQDLLRLAASAEARSEHPLARAIVQAAEQQHLPLEQAAAFQAIPGLGVEAQVGGRRVWIGSTRLFERQGVSIPDEILGRLHSFEDQGQTVMIVYAGGEWLGLLGVADTLRPEAAGVVAELKRNGVKRVVMLTGDNERVARSIAAQAGVDEFHAGLLPEAKVGLLKRLRETYGSIAMVGDGVNDAPALATADVGIAMGGAGSDVALETADVILMGDRLERLPYAIGLARQARQVVWQNLAFSLAVIVLLVVSAFGANLPLPLGVVGHEGSTVLVVLNGLRLLAFRR